MFGEGSMLLQMLYGIPFKQQYFPSSTLLRPSPGACRNTIKYRVVDHGDHAKPLRALHFYDDDPEH